MASLERLVSDWLSPAIQVSKALYRREVPLHYQGNSLTRAAIQVNVILVEKGQLCVPASTKANFLGFFQKIEKEYGQLLGRIISPSGTAKSTANEQATPIKELVRIASQAEDLPGDQELYGWHLLAAEAGHRDLEMQLLFQGNGQYFNRGSALFDGQRLTVFPDAYLARVFDEGPSLLRGEMLALEEASLKRPLLFFLDRQDGRMAAYLFRFGASESYFQGLWRLEAILRRMRARAAFAASPPLVLPGRGHDPVYLSLSEVITAYHANDVRHYLYCPYEGAVLLYAELSRAQSLQARQMARSFSGRKEDRLAIRLRETLNFVTPAKLEAVLETKGYTGRYHFSQARDGIFLHINLLEGVYSHLIPFATRSEKFGIVQTSGTRGNITGNDGPTFMQVSSILRDLNCQPPFDKDPIIAAASGSQGNDVSNVVALARDGRPELLHTLCPAAALDEGPSQRGTVTTPRIGLATA